MIRVFRIDEARVVRRGQNTFCESGCCRSCPGAPVGQRFTSGDAKGMPCGIGEVIANLLQIKGVAVKKKLNTEFKP